MKQGQVTVERVFDALTQWPCDLSDEIKCLGILVHYINDNPRIFGAPVMGNDTDYLLERIAETLSLLDVVGGVTRGSHGGINHASREVHWKEQG